MVESPSVAEVGGHKSKPPGRPRGRPTRPRSGPGGSVPPAQRAGTGSPGIPARCPRRLPGESHRCSGSLLLSFPLPLLGTLLWGLSGEAKGTIWAWTVPARALPGGTRSPEPPRGLPLACAVRDPSALMLPLSAPLPFPKPFLLPFSPLF